MCKFRTRKAVFFTISATIASTSTMTVVSFIMTAEPVLCISN